MTRSRVVAYWLIILLIVFAVGFLLTRPRQRADIPDPQFVCQDPGYTSLRDDMTGGDVERLLGQPQRVETNPGYVKRPAAEWDAIQAQADAIRRKITPALMSTGMHRLTADRDEMAAYEQLVNDENILRGRGKKTWDYDSVPGWHGSLEVTFDDRGRMIGADCGYG